MSERKILVELYVDTKQPIAEVGRLTAEMQRNKVRRDELLLISRKQRDLTVSEKRELGQLISVMKAQSNALRELTNLTSGATAAGLRFRDKMAEASRAGLGAFGLQALGIASITTAVIEGVRELAQLAAQIELVDARNKAIAGESLPQLTAAAEANANAIGLTRREYISLAADQQLRLKNLGIEGDLTAELATRTVEYAESLSDFSGGELSTQEAAKLLNDALTGQTRGLKELGINVKASKEQIAAMSIELQTSKGLTKEQADAVATLELAFRATEETMKLFGDQTLRIDKAQDAATARLNEAKEALSEGLTPALIYATEAQARLTNSFADFASEGGPFRKFLAIITVGASEGFRASVDALFGFGEEAEKAAPKVEASAKSTVELKARLKELLDLRAAFLRQGKTEAAGEGNAEIAEISRILKGRKDLAEANVNEVLTLTVLRQKLADLKKSREDHDITDTQWLKTNEEAITVLTKQIATLEISTNSTEKKTKKTKELTAAQKEQIELEKLIAGLDSGKDVLSKPQQSLAISPDKDPRVEHEAIVNDLLNTKYQENAKNYENAQDLKLEAQEASLEASGALAGSLAGLFDQQSEEFKAFAVIEALISTYLGAARALADNTIPNTFARIAAASAVVLTGLAAVKRIQGFEEGGYTDRASSNKKAVGVVHANEYVVPAPILKTSRGKALVDELEAMRMRHPIRTEIPFVSGGRTTRGSALVNTPRTGVTSDTIASADLARAIANMPTPIVRVTDINDVQGAVARTRVTASL